MSFGLNLALNLGLVTQFIDAAAGLLLDTYPATAAYSVRQLKNDATNAIRVRRSSDNAEQDIGFVDGELDTASLESFVTGYNDTLPLDTASATAAYSLRNLSSSYTGNVVRVREAGANNEQDFTAAEITDGTLASFCGQEDGFVVTWYDQSGNGNDATQATQGNQPKIYDSVTGLVTENGKPAVQFDGIDDRFIIPGFALPSALTYIMVTEYVLPTANQFMSQILIPKSSLANQVQEIVFMNVGGYKTISFNKNGASGVSGFGIDSPHASGSQILLTFTYNGGTASDINSYTLATNGTSRTPENSGSLGYLTSVASIAMRDSQGTGMSNNKIQEIIIYDTDQSANREAIEGNINQHYDIYSANGFVTTWYDQSGNANDASQATQGNQPKIYDSVTGLVTENGKPAVQFDGANSWFDNVYTMPETLAVSFFGVYAYNSLNTARVISNNNNRLYINRTAATFTLSPGISLSTLAEQRLTTLIQDEVTTGLSGTITGWGNGTQESTATATVGDPLSRVINLGAQNASLQQFNGTMQEIIFYNNNQTANREAIEGNINTFYNIY